MVSNVLVQQARQSELKKYQYLIYIRYFFIIIIWVYIFMFVTYRQAHWVRDLPILKILSVMLLLGSVLAMIRQAYVSEWIKVVWCVNRY